jgi:hypothetical protein
LEQCPRETGELNDGLSGQVLPVEPVAIGIADALGVHYPLAGEAQENLTDTFLRIAIEHTMELPSGEGCLVLSQHGKNIPVECGRDRG